MYKHRHGYFYNNSNNFCEDIKKYINEGELNKNNYEDILKQDENKIDNIKNDDNVHDLFFLNFVNKYKTDMEIYEMDELNRKKMIEIEHIDHIRICITMAISQLEKISKDIVLCDVDIFPERIEQGMLFGILYCKTKDFKFKVELIQDTDCYPCMGLIENIYEIQNNKEMEIRNNKLGFNRIDIFGNSCGSGELKLFKYMVNNYHNLDDYLLKIEMEYKNLIKAILENIKIEYNDIELSEINTIYDDENMSIHLDTTKIYNYDYEIKINVFRKSDKMAYITSFEKRYLSKEHIIKKSNYIKKIIGTILKHKNFTIDNVSQNNSNILLEQSKVQSTLNYFFKKYIICFVKYPDRLYLKYEIIKSGCCIKNFYLEFENNGNNYNMLLDCLDSSSIDI